MKKNLTIIASAVLALGMLFVTGCKHQSNLGDDTSNADSNVNGALSKLYITAEEYPIEWWVLTDVDGIVLQYNANGTGDIKSIKAYDETQKTTKGDRNYKAVINKGDTIEITFNDSYFEKGSTNNKKTEKKTNVYIKQNRELKYQNGKDTLTKINHYVSVAGADVSKKTGRRTSDKKIVSAPNSTRNPVGTVKLICNETGSTRKEGEKVVNGTYPVIDFDQKPAKLVNKSGDVVIKNGIACKVNSWSGNYNITKVQPYAWSDTESKFVNTENLTINLDIKEGESAEFIFPADVNTFFAITQPNRFDMNKTNEATEAQKQNGISWCFKTQVPACTSPVQINSTICAYQKKSDTEILDGKGNSVRSAYTRNIADLSDFTVPDYEK